MHRQIPSNRLITHYLLLLLLVLISNIGYAQPPGGDGAPPPGGGPSAITAVEIADLQTSWMKKKLKLDKEQTDQVLQINVQYINGVKELSRNNSTATDSILHRQEKFTMLDKNKDDSLQRILSEKQFGLYLKNKTFLNSIISTSGNQGMPPPPPPGGME